MPHWINPLWQRNLSKTASGKPGAVHCQDWFGAAEGPNWLRKCLRTTASLEGPEYALDASEVLAHSPEVSIRHYVKAQASRAVERHGIHLAKLRRSSAPLAASAYGWRGTLGHTSCASNGSVAKTASKDARQAEPLARNIFESRDSGRIGHAAEEGDGFE